MPEKEPTKPEPTLEQKLQSLETYLEKLKAEMYMVMGRVQEVKEFIADKNKKEKNDAV